ncbi:unnamed protein product [Closterium sp. Yama58-4]|nr:unnamed protein product [Closterium sp. Yama58-4]
MPWQKQSGNTSTVESAAEQSPCLFLVLFLSLPVFDSSFYLSVSPCTCAEPLQKLSGNTSAVESTLLSRTEDQAISGVLSGSVKLWDLNEGKGVLSGSVKLWDLNEGKGEARTVKLSVSVKVARGDSTAEQIGGPGDLGSAQRLCEAVGPQRGQRSENQAISGVLSSSVKLWDLNEGKGDSRTVKLSVSVKVARGDSTAEQIGGPGDLGSAQRLGEAVGPQRGQRSEDQAISGVLSGSLKLWELNEGTVQRGSALALDFHLFEPFVASGSLDFTARVWDPRQKEAVHVLASPLPPPSPYLHPTSTSCAVRTLMGHRGSALSLDFHPFEPFFASAMRTLTGHRGSALSLDFHPFEPFFASGSLDSTARVWDPRQKEAVHMLKNPLPPPSPYPHPTSTSCAHPDRSQGFGPLAGLPPLRAVLRIWLAGFHCPRVGPEAEGGSAYSEDAGQGRGVCAVQPGWAVADDRRAGLGDQAMGRAGGQGAA